MASCKGKTKGGSGCGMTVKKCSNCGNLGCERTDCDNNAFQYGTCRKCGKNVKKVNV